MKNLLEILLKSAGRVILLAAVLGSTVGYAQQTEVGLRMEVDKRQVEVGDDLTVTLQFRQLGSGNATVLGDPQIPTPENMEIRGTSSSTQVTIINNQTAAISTTKLRLVATKPGVETLGPALLLYQDDQGKKREIKSNVATVTVVEKTGFSLFGKKKNAEPDTSQPQAGPTPTAQPSGDDLRGLKPLLPESHMIIKLVFWLILLGAIGILVWRIMRRPAKAVSTPLMGKPAQLKDAWKKLGNEDLSGKEFCLGLSNLARECLQYRFDFQAVDFTTEEILKALPEKKLSGDEAGAVEKILKTCDRVLYADANLTGRDNLRSLCSQLLPKPPKN